MVSSILPFIAIHMDVTCSAAFATIGRRMRPMKALGIWLFSATSSMEATTSKTKVKISKI